MAKADLTAARLRELLHYDPETGTFTWLRRPASMFDGDLRACGAWNARYAGKTAGAGSKVGYWTIHVIDRAYWAHRLAFLYMTGEWPSLEIDHMNGLPLDNRWANLREASRKTNAQNVRAARTNKAMALPLGVFFKRIGLRKPYVASVHTGSKRRHLGYFATAEEAHLAYLVAKRELHAGCTI